MNALFTAVFLLSAAFLLFTAPQEFLPALLSAASSSAALCVALLSSYAVFCGLSALWEKSGIAAVLAKFLRKPVKRLFKSNDPEFAESVCMNISANLLGIGALATPYGVKAAKLLDGSKGIGENEREYALAVLFALNAASLQLVPTSVIALRTSAGSAAPSSVVLPILFSSAFFLLLALPCTRLAYGAKLRRGKNAKLRRGAKRKAFQIKSARRAEI